MPAFFALLISGCDSGTTIDGERYTHSLEVTATAYTSSPRQTQGDPFVGAWNNRLAPGMKVLAVSRDLLKRGLTNGTRVRIDGLPGVYEVRDKMNRRYTKRIDIYMGVDVKRARKWGKKRVTIHWTPPVPTPE